MLVETIVNVWPNYEWCYDDDLEEYLKDRSDDYMVCIVVTSDQLDEEYAIEEYLKYYKPQG